MSDKQRRLRLTIRLKQDAPRISQGILAEYDVKLTKGSKPLQANAMSKLEMNILKELIELEWEELEEE